MTREEKNKMQREYRLQNGNMSTKKYEKTVNGFLMRVYINMKSRIVGVQKKNLHLYFGKELLDREQFYHWSILNEDFLRLFCEWELSGYDRMQAPSIDRINPSGGFLLVHQLSRLIWEPYISLVFCHLL